LSVTYIGDIIAIGGNDFLSLWAKDTQINNNIECIYLCYSNIVPNIKAKSLNLLKD